MADHSHDVVDEQTRNVLMAPRDGQDLHNDLDQSKEYVGSAAQVGAANQGVVALAPPPTTRRDLLRHLAHIELTALSRDDPQPQLAPIPATGKRPSVISLTEINVRKLRLQVAPLLGITASTFCVAMIPFPVLTMKRSLTNGGYGRVYTAQWNDKTVVIKKFKGEEAEKNASRELGQVQLGRVSSYVVPLVGFTWWVSDTGEQMPCLVYPYAGTTLWAVISDQDRHPLANPLGVCAEICNAVHSLHTDSGMLHLDLKGDNVILRTNQCTPGEYKVRLIDLGTSQPVGDNHNPYLQQGRNKSNEKHWFAPEWKHDRCLTPHTDTWSLGYLLADCLLPLGGGKYHTVAPSPGLISKKFDAEVEGIVLRCFNKAPRFRPSLVALKTLFKAKRSPIMSGLP